MKKESYSWNLSYQLPGMNKNLIQEGGNTRRHRLFIQSHQLPLLNKKLIIEISLYQKIPPLVHTVPSTSAPQQEPMR